MTQRAPAGESLLELSEALAQRQLRDAGAEIASAIAHAVGTPLNVISGRAELIRHDPSNALAQVARIEEQVKKLATGLRQIVDYLAVPEPRPVVPAPRAAASVSAPAARIEPVPSALPVSTEPAEIVDAKSILSDVAALAAPVCQALDVELAVDGGADLEGARVERWHALGVASSLVSAALRQARVGESAAGNGAGRETSERRRCSLRGSLGPQGVGFELVVPGLAAVQGWQLEHFHARPAPAEGTEFHRTMSICATMVRGHGGRLQSEAAPDGRGLVIRFWCRNEAASPRG